MARAGGPASAAGRNPGLVLRMEDAPPEGGHHRRPSCADQMDPNVIESLACALSAV